MLSRAESIQGQVLEVTVVSGTRLKDTEWFSRQDPYVFVKYGSKSFRTLTCTDGGKNPVFGDTFNFKLYEGLREIEISVYNSNTLSSDDFIGSGKVYLHDVLSSGYQEYSCTLINNRRSAGEIKLRLRYPNAQFQNREAKLPQPQPQQQQPPPSPKPFYMNNTAPPAQYPPYPTFQPQYYPPQPPAYVPFAPPPREPSYVYPPQGPPPRVYPPQSPFNGYYHPPY